ncbi:MAG: hypothetical protein RL745_946, partial [Actinomycetota bacterium]
VFVLIGAVLLIAHLRREFRERRQRS